MAPKTFTKKQIAEIERAAAAKALNAFADKLGVNNDEDDSEYEQGYRHAQRSTLSRLNSFIKKHYPEPASPTQLVDIFDPGGRGFKSRPRNEKQPLIWSFPGQGLLAFR